MNALISGLFTGLMGVVGLCLPTTPAWAQTPRVVDGLKLEKVLDGLDHPWSLAFLPAAASDQAPEALVMQRGAGLLRVKAPADGAWTVLNPVPVPGVQTGAHMGAQTGAQTGTQAGAQAGAQTAAQTGTQTGTHVAVQGQGGWFDVALHPDFARQPWVYISYNGMDAQGLMGTELLRARWTGNGLTQPQHLFALQPKTRSTHHFGGRIVLDGKGYLFLALGDRGDMARAQRSHDPAGSVIRLTDAGQTPADNPWINQPGWLPQTYSKGHRNIQGAAWHPQTGQLWTHEHGPQGGDEINIVQPGRNYGWPVITYGVQYGSGAPIGEGTHKPGMEQPLHTWVPSIAPSGMAFVPPDNQPFAAWRGQLLVGALRDQMLVRLELDGPRVVREHRLLRGAVGRVRDVRVGPGGFIYLLTDANPGAIYRLSPAP